MNDIDGEEKPLVLVVDDDPLILRSVRDALATAGFRAVVTADPGEALALVELYARVSSDRRDVDLSVAAHHRLR